MYSSGQDVEDSSAAGQQRNIKTSVAGTTAGARRRQQAALIGKDRRDALLRAKRIRRGGPGSEGGMAEEKTASLGMEEGMAAMRGAEEQVELAVKRLQAALSGPAKGATGEKIAALRSLRQLLSAQTVPPLGAAVRAGVVPLLIDCLGFGAPEEQLADAVWCLSNIAGGEREQTLAVLPASALLVAHLGEKSPPAVVDHCAWAVSNLAAEGAETSSVLLGQGALPALARLVLTGAASPAKGPITQTAAWALSNLLKSSPARTAVELIRTEGIPAALVTLLGRGDERLASEVAWVLVYVTAKSDACAERLLAAGVALPLLSLLMSATEPASLTPVVRTLGNMTAMDDSKTDAILAAGSTLPGGALGAFARCLESSHRTVQKEAAWAVSNVAGGAPAHKHAVLRGAAFQPLLHLLRTAAFDIKREAAFALGNVCVARQSGPQKGAAPPQVELEALGALLQAGCLGSFLGLLRSPDAEAARLGLQFVEMVLRAMPNKQGPKLVEQEDGIDALESLQFHGNEELRVMANSLVDHYFGADYGLEEEYGSEAMDRSGGGGGGEGVEYPPWRQGGNGVRT